MTAIITVVLGMAAAFAFVIYAMSFKTKSEKEYDKKLEASLEDEFIIDPETGAKITLKEAESGHWDSHDNEFNTIPESDIDKLLSEEYKQAQLALNYLRESKDFIRTELTDEQFEVFEKTKILSNYADWSYSNPFSFKNGVVIFPAPELNGATYYDVNYTESHVMFWTKMKSIDGHYYLREKLSVEKVFDHFRNDDDLTLNGYESFTFKQSKKAVLINQILKKLEGEPGLEIEMDHDNLFIKTKRLVSTEDIKRIENILNKIG